MIDFRRFPWRELLSFFLQSDKFWSEDFAHVYACDHVIIKTRLCSMRYDNATDAKRASQYAGWCRIILYFAVREQLDDRANDFLELNSHSSLLSESSSANNDMEESYDIPEWTQIVGWPALDFILDRLGATSDVILCLIIPPAVAAVVMYEGYKSALAAVKKWKESGAPDATQAV